MNCNFNIIEHTRRGNMLELKVRALLKQTVMADNVAGLLLNGEGDPDLYGVERSFNGQLDKINTGNNMRPSYAYKLEQIINGGKLAGLQLVHLNSNGDADRKVLSVIPKEVAV